MNGLLMHQAFLASAGRQPSKVAVRFENREILYRELAEDVRRLSCALQEGLGLAIGSRVGILMPNRPEFYVAALAIAHAGLVCVPLPVSTTPRELVYFIADSGMAALFVDDSVAERLGDALDGIDGNDLALHQWDQARRGANSVRQLMASGAPSTRAVPVDDAQPFFFGYTSGTTGAPKAAVISHRARTALTLMLGQEYGCYAASDTALVTTPLYHGAGLTRGLAPLLTGGSVVLHRHFDPELAVEALATPRVTTAFMVPTMFAAIFGLGERTVARLQSSAMTILSNAAPLADGVKAQILDNWRRVRLFEIYGSTEAGTVSSLRPEDQRRKSRCVGLPLAHTEVAILDETGNPVAEGEAGELWSRSPFVFSHYHNKEEATAAAFRDGFVSVGDVSRRDGEGHLYIVGRKAEVIISGGVNVYPREIEEILAAHPTVKEAAVVGVPDKYWGERVHAVLVAERGGQIDVSQIEKHCRGLLAPQKVPRSIEVRPDLPHTSTGKVAKHLIKLE